MLDRIIRFSIHNKLIVGLLVLALVAWGTYSATRLPIDAVPDITNNQVQVITVSPALAALDMERLVTFPVEQSLKTIPNQVELRSLSRFGLSIVTIVFTDETDIYWARQQVLERLDEARSQIPPGVGDPELAPVSTGLGEIYQYTLQAKPGYEAKYSLTELRSIQDWIVRRDLLGTPGVADVSSFGGYLKQYEVAVDPARLRSMGISLEELYAAVESSNQNTGGAYIERGTNAYFIRTEGLVQKPEDIEQTVVREPTNGAPPLLLRDVAQVQEGHAVRYGALTVDTTGEAVGGIVMMLKGANSSEVVNAVKTRMAAIEQTLPEGIAIVPFLDRTALVDRAIATVSTNLAEGALIVVFVLVLLLGNWRAGALVASVIPLALLFAIGMMTLFGVSGNLMSLGAIDFGLIVDGAVIIVEAIVHRLALRSSTLRLSRQQMNGEVYEAASRIRSSAAFGELIILIVYLPILALEGIEGKMFRPMAQTVAFAILGAFILSLTYVPMMAALVLPKQSGHKRNLSDRMMDVAQRAYRPLLEWVLRRTRLVVGMSIGLFAGALLLFSTLGGEFIPTLEEGDVAIGMRLMTGGSLSQSVATNRQVAHVLFDKFPEVKRVVGKVGAAEIPTDPMPVEATDIIVMLNPDHSNWQSAANQTELVEQMEEALAVIPGLRVEFSQPIQLRFNELMTGARQDVAVKLYGDDLNVLARIAPQIASVVQRVEGAQDIFLEQVGGLPQIVVQLDRTRLAQYGIPVETVNRTVNMAFAGQTAGVVYDGEQRYDLVLRLDSANRRGIADVQNLPVTSSDGHSYPLSALADVALQRGPNQVQREQGRRRITVGFNVRGRDVESVVREVQAGVTAKVKLPPGYSLEYGGQFENLAAARARLSIAVPVALALIFLLLFFTFGSAGQSLLVFMAIPLSAIGGVLALWLRGMPFSISAGIGFIALFGVAVLNGIVLVSEFNHLAKAGVGNLLERVRQGTANRLRPVLMTALVASLGFLPMAISGSAGAEVQRPLATVVIGGLVTATLLTLLVLPVLYLLYTRRFGAPASAALDEGEGSGGNKPAGAVAVVVLMLVASPLLGQAQPSSRLTVDRAVAVALEQNLGLAASRQEVGIQRVLRRTSSEIAPTAITWTLGNTNGPAFDDNLTVSQTLPWPGRFSAQRKLADARIGLASTQVDAQARQLVFAVRMAYDGLVFQLARQRLLQQQDSLLAGFVRAANVRYRTGETGVLEPATAQVEQERLRAQLRQTAAAIEVARTALEGLLRSPVAVAELDTLGGYNAPPLPVDSLEAPALQLARQELALQRHNTRLERSRLLPDFTVGYFNQSLAGTYEVDGAARSYGRGDRFQGALVGIAVPLWARPQVARLQASRLAEQQAETRLADLEVRLAALQRQRQLQYTTATEAAQAYRNAALPQARLLRTQASKSFQAGETGYQEYVLALQRALELELEYLNLVHSANHAAYALQLQADDILSSND